MQLITTSDKKIKCACMNQYLSINTIIPGKEYHMAERKY
jgi:hypothetical protein